MLSRRRQCGRSGFTIVELLVSMVVAGIVLALLTLTGLRYQRLVGDLLDDASLSSQVGAAAALLPIDLRTISASAGDIREARDTSLEFRSTIANAVVCDTASESLVLAAASTGPGTYTSYASSIQAGDTAWLFDRGDSVDNWRPHRVAAVATAAAGQCGPAGPTLPADVAGRQRTSITLDSTPHGSSMIGRPLRVTRAVRYSLYRSSDGTWNLGERDWNPVTLRFNTIQPLAGAFLSASSLGIAFTYLDSAGGQLPLPLTNPRALAAIDITLRGETQGAVRALGSAQRQGRRSDSATIAVLLRNRR